jgi:hypothetical protein
MRGDLGGRPPGGGGADSARAEHSGQLRLLGDRVVFELMPFLGDLGVYQLILG